MKKCKRCRQEKPLSEYSNMKGCLHGKRPRCKKCRCEIELKHRRTKKGLLRTIYASQLQSSTHRCHPSPKYNLKELTEWELDKDYYKASVERFENHKKQLQLF